MLTRHDDVLPWHRYDELDLAAYDCTNITLVRGDRLYMPFGVLHRAITRDDQRGSVHLSMQFVKDGITWSDLILQAVGYVDGEALAPFVAEMQTFASSRGVPALMMAVLLRGALRFDPGYFPDFGVCPDGSCLYFTVSCSFTASMVVGLCMACSVVRCSCSG